MKKYVIFIIALVLLVSLFGCAAPQTEEGAKQENNSQSSAKDPATDENKPSVELPESPNILEDVTIGSDTPIEQEPWDVSEVVFYEEKKLDIDLDSIKDMVEGYQKTEAFKNPKPIDTKEQALQLAVAIMDEKNNRQYGPEIYLAHVTYFSDDNVWEYCYSPNRYNTPPENLVDGGGVYIYVNGSDGNPLGGYGTE